MLVQAQSTTTQAYIWEQQSPYDCNFDHDFCSWSNDNTTKLKWLRSTGLDPEADTGPTSDHTSPPRGYFIHASCDVSNAAYDNFRLVSPLVTDIDTSKCLEFYYFAYGAEVDELNVFLKVEKELGLPVWTRRRNQGNQWLRGEIRIAKTSTPYQIVFEANVLKPSAVCEII